MVVLKQDAPFGHAPHPQTPYAILTNLPGWQLTKDFREGDMRVLARIKHIYPRFLPWSYVGQLGVEIAKFTGHEGMSVMPFLNPSAWSYAVQHATSPSREEARIPASAVTCECVSINGERIFAVLFEPQHGKAFIGAWQNCGLGLSIRHAERLLQGIEEGGLERLEGVGLDKMPEATWTAEGKGHERLRERIVELLKRAPIEPDKVTCQPKDVFLYPTGMAALWYMASWISELKPGAAVVLGIPFHNTYHHLLEEAKGGMVNFGDVSEAGLDVFEAWLDEQDGGRRVSWVYVEFPCNPSLETPDIERLKALSEKHGFVLVVDDTLSGFANVDVLPCSDMLATSLTKSFSSQADCMGGSLVLNPLSPHYSMLSRRWASSFRNELFLADADVLLHNARGFLDRTAAFNANAAAMADHLHARWVGKPNSPVVAVRYPPYLSTAASYGKRLRPSTPELPLPGYGCLFTIDFASEDLAAAFYDRGAFLPTPHLAAPVTLQLAYNMLVFGRKPEERAYVRRFGIREESVRISAGWREDAADLVDTLDDALMAVMEQSMAKNGVANGEVTAVEASSHVKTSAA